MGCFASASILFGGFMANKNIISLSPEKAVSYCEIVLSELALKPSDENSIISPTYITLDFLVFRCQLFNLVTWLIWRFTLQYGRLS
jgi:hypothetical protein